MKRKEYVGYDKLRFKFDSANRYEDKKYFNESSRELLFNSVKINGYLSPQIENVIKDIKDSIGYQNEINVFVKSNPHINAYSYLGLENEINILLTSALVNIMTIDELKFVISHECAHSLYQHYKPFIVGLSDEAMRFLGNASEISCDRFAHTMVDNPLSSYSALLKIESGLSQDKLNLNVREYLLEFKNVIDSDLIFYTSNSSHPFINTRIRALLLFETSDLYYEIMNYNDKSPLEINRIDLKISDDIIKNGFIRFDLIEKDTYEKMRFWEDLIDVIEKRISQDSFMQLYGADKYAFGMRTYHSEGKTGLNRRLQEKKDALSYAVYLI